MKKLLFVISCFISLIASGQAQPSKQSLGNLTNEVWINGYGSAYKGFALRNSWSDTTAANLDPFLKNIAGIHIRTGDIIWQRSADLSRWFVAGAGSIVVDTSSSVLLSGDGSLNNPLTANVVISGQQGNALIATGSGLYVPNFIQDGIKVPGVISWIQNYDYDVSPATAVIGGVEYTSDWTPITLATADPTLDRIDLVVFNAGVGSSTGTITVITGTPATNPEQPTLADPLTQLAMAFILVTANTTEPPTPPAQDWIYQNYITNAWTTLSSTARINDQSLINPYSVPTDVEFTLAQNGDNIRFTAVSPPTISDFNIVTLKIRSKAVWPEDSRIEIRFYNGATPIGTPVAIAHGSFGFNSAQISSYQIASIPLYFFGSLVNVTNVLITVRTSGGRTIGAYVDDIQLQEGVVPSIAYTASNGVNLVGSDFQLGSPLTKNTSINTGQFGLSLSGTTASVSTFNFTTFNTTGSAIKGQTTSGIGVQGNSAGFFGVLGTNTVGPAGGFLFTNASGSTVAEVLNIQRAATVTPLAGMGASLRFSMAGTASPLVANLTSNRIVSAWTDPTTLSQTSQLVFTGTSGGVEADLVTISGSGAQKWNKYGVGSFTAGTPAYGLAVDASGNIIEAPVGGGISAITGDNGLTANTSTNVRLGGVLVTPTTVDGESANKMIFTSTVASATDSATVVIRNTGAGTGRGLYITSASGVGLIVNSAAGVNAAIVAQTSAGQSLTGVASTTGVALVASATEGRAGTFTTNPTSSNDVAPIISIGRNTSGTPANGIGGAIDYQIELTGTADTSTRLISTWTDVASPTRTSEFSIQGVNNNSSNTTLFVLSGNGRIRYNNYGVGSFTAGTPAYTLQVDASGNIMEGALSGGVYTASNGLTMTANNTVLGGTLTGATTVNSGGFLTLFTGSNTTGVFNITNSGTGNAGVFQDVGSSATVDILKNNSNTNSDRPILSLERFTSGTAANGIAGTIDLYLESDAGSSTIANQILWKYTTAANATRTSQMVLSGVNSAVANNILTLNGNGSVQLNDYGINTFAGVAAYVLGVDASGNLVEVAAAGAGMTNVLTTTGDIIYSSSGTTPARLGIGTNGQYLAVSAGGIPEWVTPGVGGSVTSVAQSFTGGLISVSGSPITTSGTLALTVAGTSGGVPYFSSSSTWASSAALAANAIVIGGGAGAAPSTTTTGTGVLTALGVNTGSAGAFVVNGGDLGTPSAGVATNLTGTATALNIGGNAATATILQTARTINGTSFDGSTNITVTAAAGTLTGTTLNGTVVTSSLTSVGTIGTGLWQGTTVDELFGGTGNTSYATGDILYASATNTLSKLTAGTNGFVLTLAAGVPTWAAAGSGTLTSLTINQPSAGFTVTNNGVALTTSGTWTFTLANDLAAIEALATTGIVRRTGTSTWTAGTAVSLTTEVSGTLPEANGGTGETTYSNGQLLIGDGTGLTKATLTAANGISITNGAGSITVSTVFNPTRQTLTDGATITWNVTNGGNAVVTLAGTGRTLSITNPVAGYTYTVEIVQGSGGSKTITTWPTGTTWPSGVAPTLSTTAGDVDVVVLYYNGSSYRGSYETDYN